ncbi:MAG: diguanylate cyclase [Acidobacteriota bacterium]
MTEAHDPARVRQQLLELLSEDLHNEKRLLDELDHIRAESGVEAHSALLLTLTHLPFEHHEARSHWEAILRHHAELRRRTGRPVGVRLAVFDYFMNINRRLVNPKIIELSMFEHAEKQANNDWLTGLYNQKFFRSSLGTELRRCKRFGLVFSLLYLDIDNFRDVVNRCGRAISDILLKEVAVLIKNKVRDIDLAARWSGEEFLVALPETERMGAYVVGERVRTAVEQHFLRREHAGRAVRLTVSGGIAEYPSDAGVGEKLIQGAAEALYQAKARGKNRVSVFFRERRDYIRFDTRHRQLRVQVLDTQADGPAEAALSTKNISRSGMLFDSETPYVLGQRLELVCSSTEGAESITLNARVIRVEELDATSSATRYEIGVAFQFQWERQEQEFADFMRQEKLEPAGPQSEKILS